MFPPGWLPCFSIGIGVCFLVRDYFKETNVEVYSARKWGLLTDLISFVLLAGWIGYGLTDSLAKPQFVQEMEAGSRYWAALVSRLVCPIGFLWYVGICIGKGVTGWLLSGRIIVSWLAPASYNIFLFHGPISELYFFATRRVWWAFPKSLYWFSPYPVPVRIWEIPVVMAIVTIFSMVMHFFVNDKLIYASTYCLSCFQKQRTQDEKSIATVVKEVLARVSNIDPSMLTGETDLTEIGISSMALPVAISDINLELKGLDNSRHLSSSSLSLKGGMSVNGLIAQATAGKYRTSVPSYNEVENDLGLDLDIGINLEEGNVVIAG